MGILAEKKRRQPTTYLKLVVATVFFFCFPFLPGSFSRKGSLANERWGGQSPAIPESPDVQVTNPRTGGMGDGWWRGLDGRFSKKRADGWGVSTSMAVVPAQSKSRRLAAKACWVAKVKMADHREKRGTRGQALRTMSGAALYFFDGRGVEEVQETCSFRAPRWSPLSPKLLPPICTGWISFEHDATSEHDYKVYQAENNTFSANKSHWKNTCLQQRCFSIKRLKITMRVSMAS